MVAGAAGMMLVLAIAAKRLLVVHLAGKAVDPLAGEEQDKENGDNDKRHKLRGFLSVKHPKKHPDEKCPGRFPRKQERL